MMQHFRSKHKNHTVDTLFTFVLLLIFALFTFMLTALGSHVYKNGVAHLNENYTSRTALSYVTEKIRQHDQSEQIEFTEIDHIPAIVLHEELSDHDFVTYVYFYENMLRELLVAIDREPKLSLGTPLVELSVFDFSYNEPSRLLTVTAASPGDGSHSISTVIHLNS